MMKHPKVGATRKLAAAAIVPTSSARTARHASAEKKSEEAKTLQLKRKLLLPHAPPRIKLGARQLVVHTPGNQMNKSFKWKPTSLSTSAKFYMHTAMDNPKDEVGEWWPQSTRTSSSRALNKRKAV
eukprot:2671553-Amphidinium_carterae.1